MGNTSTPLEGRTVANGIRRVYIERVGRRLSRHRWYWSVDRFLPDGAHKIHSGWSWTASGARRKCSRIVFQLERLP
jgi:hypothetical protein